MPNAKEMLELLENISGALGGDNENHTTESAMADLLTVRDYLENVDNEITALNDDVERLNNRALELQKANNLCLRKMNAHLEEEDSIKPMKEEKQFAQLF